MWTAAEISLRAETADDASFLEELVIAVREGELGYRELPADVRNRLLKQQNQLQLTHYRKKFPKAFFLIVEANSKPVGRLYLNHLAERIHVIEFSLLPEMQGHGIGHQLLKNIQAEAIRTQVPIALSVSHGNPAETFYQRLGFQATGSTDTHLRMQWQPPAK